MKTCFLRCVRISARKINIHKYTHALWYIMCFKFASRMCSLTFQICPSIFTSAGHECAFLFFLLPSLNLHISCLSKYPCHKIWFPSKEASGCCTALCQLVPWCVSNVRYNINVADVSGKCNLSPSEIQTDIMPIYLLDTINIMSKNSQVYPISKKKSLLKYVKKK